MKMCTGKDAIMKDGQSTCQKISQRTWYIQYIFLRALPEVNLTYLVKTAFQIIQEKLNRLY